MTGSQHSVDVPYRINQMECFGAVAHQLLGTNVPAGGGYLVCEDRHLLGSDSSIIQTSGEQVSSKIGNSNRNDCRQEDIDRLGSFHHDDDYRVSHPRISSKHGSHRKNDICRSEILSVLNPKVYNFLLLQVQKKMNIQITKTTSNDHSWKKEARRHIHAVSGYGPKIPYTGKQDHLLRRAHHFGPQELLDDATFCFPEERCQRIIS